MEFLPVDDLCSDEIILRLEKTCEAQSEKQWVPAYYFSICLPDGTGIGHCDLRIGHNDRLYIGGNIGYGIDEAYRGHHYALKACELLIRLARKHHLEYVIITCAPDNKASQRTCELAGGRYIETAAVPEWHNMYEEGMRQVMVYRFDLEDAPKGKAGISDVDTVRKQYGTASRLNTRISIHSKYSTNKQGFGNWITSHYRLRKGMAVLELGCGTGEMWLGKGEIIGGCSRLILSDFSEGMLNKAKETLCGQEGIEFRIVDIRDIPFADHEFDAVIANMMLYHVTDLEKGLREVRRVMKDDGTFYCATYGENGMMKYICGLFEDRHIRETVNDAFTLQNGERKLKTVFSDVERFLYEDSLEVTDAGDMVDYIYSLQGMTELRKLPESEIRSVLEKNMRDGVLRVPKEYGMFIAGGFSTGTGLP
ncbi:MAG: GNAT family N-acetyltransferase [Clostridia bacterium]|nr:GNAT family N-acetyltransferase [Clostridia bacterium]